jgi:hypothetical protein
MNKTFNEIKWLLLKAKHRDLSTLTAADLIEAELEAMRTLGIPPAEWARAVFILRGSETGNDPSKN